MMAEKKKGDIFRVAVLQARPEAGAVGKNMEKIMEAMEEAARSEADILLLPEVFLTGYHLPVTNSEAVGRENECIQEICRHAEKLGIGCVLTAFTKGKERPRNTAFVIDKEGQIILQYDKVHTCDFADEKCLEHGNRFKVCDYDGVQIGIMICYDREYPESARILMLKGAEIILVPNDCALMKHRVNALETRAYENMTGIVMANPPGEKAGRSCAFSPVPWNEQEEEEEMLMFLADECTERIYLADYHMDAVREYRSREMMGNTFRKTAAYGPLTDPEVKPPFIR